MKRIFLCMALLFITLSFATCQTSDKIKSYISRAQELSDKYEWLSFNVHLETYGDSVYLWERKFEVILHYNKKDPIVFANETTEYGDIFFKMTKDNIEIVNEGNNDITVYKNFHIFTDLYHCFGIQQELYSYFKYIGYYILPMQNKLRTEIYVPTTPQGQYAKEKISIEGRSFTNYKSSNESLKGLRHENVHSFVNDSSGLLDSVYYTCIYSDDSTFYERFYKMDNFDFSDKQNYIDSIFKLDSQRYKHFNYHYNSNPNYYSKNKEINTEILDYPLVNINCDTTTIKEYDSWILLNFWRFSCGPCLKNMENYKHEKDSLGYRVLENNDIKILAINYESNNMEQLSKLAEKDDSKDIIYSAKGIKQHINLPFQGYYYLISPKKEIVYETSHLGDYSELLKAKAKYEEMYLKNKK